MTHLPVNPRDEAAPVAPGFVGLDKKGRRARWARDVYHSALAGHINERGAATITVLASRFGWFWVRLTRLEIEQLVESARVADVVMPLGQTVNARGEPITDVEWTTTPSGRKLGRPRAAGVRDLLATAGTSGWSAVKESKGVVELVGALGSVFGLTALALWVSEPRSTLRRACSCSCCSIRES